MKLLTNPQKGLASVDEIGTKKRIGVWDDPILLRHGTCDELGISDMPPVEIAHEVVILQPLQRKKLWERACW